MIYLGNDLIDGRGLHPSLSHLKRNADYLIKTLSNECERILWKNNSPRILQWTEFILIFLPQSSPSHDDIETLSALLALWESTAQQWIPLDKGQ